MLNRLGRMALLFAAAPYMVAAELRALADGPRELAAVRSLLDHTIGERDEARRERDKRAAALTVSEALRNVTGERDELKRRLDAMTTRVSELEATAGRLADTASIRARTIRDLEAQAIELQAEVDKARAERDASDALLGKVQRERDAAEDERDRSYSAYADLAGAPLPVTPEPVDAEPCAESTFVAA